MIQEKKNSSVFLKLLVCFFITSLSFAQYTIPEIPSLQTSVYDYANVLSATEKSQLEEKLIHYSDSTTTQIVVITIESLKGEDVSQLATKWGQTWGIGGTAKDDNGVIILLAKDERKIAINPGYGLEDKLTAGEIQIFLSAFANKIMTPLSFSLLPPIPHVCPHFGVKIPMSSPFRLSIVITTIWVEVESEYRMSFSSNCVFS